MNKPKVLFLTLGNYDSIGLNRYFDVSYYNYKMPVEVFHEKAKDADLIIEQEFNDGKSLYAHLTKDVKVPKAMWFIDKYGIFKYHSGYSDSYDHIFMAIDGMRADCNKPVTHLPLAFYFPINLMNRVKAERDYTMSFVGNIDCYLDRKNFFDKFVQDLSAKGISHNIKVAGWREYADAVQDSYIGFNRSGAFECNFRVFETLGFGAMLLTDRNDECMKIPELADRAFFYDSYDDIFSQIEKIKSIPANDYENMVRDNQHWIANNHLVIYRYLEIARQAIGYENSRTSWGIR